MDSYSDLSDRAAVEWAMAEFDRLGRDAFLQEYGYREAKEFFVVAADDRYDSEAIFGAAYRRQHGVTLSHDDILSDEGAAARRIADLGFAVEGFDESPGRKTFTTFEAALNHYQIPLENLPTVREFLAGKQYAEFYIPKSGSYIAAVPEDGVRKAFIHFGYIWHRIEKGVGEVIELPINRIHGGGYWRNTKREQPRESCPIHHTELPVSGVCPYC